MIVSHLFPLGLTCQVINPQGIPYFPFLCWIGLWSMIMHFAIATLNGVVFLKYVTRFSCDGFGILRLCHLHPKGRAGTLPTRYYYGPCTNLHPRSSWLSLRQGNQAATYPSLFRFWCLYSACLFKS